jgi:PKHD-type hydroxylase
MSSLVNYTYWKWDEALSKEFCQATLEQADWAAATDGFINPDNKVSDPKTRRTDVIWQNQMQPLGCVARTYMDAANQATGWGFNLSWQDETQLGRYKSTDQGHYDWHVDAYPPKDGVQRKLSCVILLNDASEFEGGALELKGVDEQIVFTKRGSIIVFPSFIEHRVTPVTKGVRYTAVVWGLGAPFK